MPPSPGLLVSVRSALEATAALAGGADLIDVKEPAHGPLGRAADVVVAEVIATVAGRRPVSAALGEWVEGDGRVPTGPAYVKWGLAGCAREVPWRELLTPLLDQAEGPRVVVVAYADWQCALAPTVDEVVDFACSRAGNILLIDTCCKARTMHGVKPTLLDWLSVEEVVSICRRCRDAGVRIALAGSLGEPEIERLRSAEPSWFAVRGAACQQGERESSIDKECVARLAQIIRG